MTYLALFLTLAISEFYFEKSRQASVTLNEPRFHGLRREFRTRLLISYQKLKDPNSVEFISGLDTCNKVALGEAILELQKFFEYSSEPFSKSLVGRLTGF